MMNKRQFSMIIAALKSNYRNFGVESKEQMEFWYSMLQDIDYPILETAVKKLVSELVYPPTIADIRNAVAETTEMPALDAAGAWGEVRDAIRYYGSYRKKDALESLSPLTRQVVQGMGWQELCYSENQMADRAHFMKMYETLVEREKKEKVIPLPVKENIERLQANRQMISNNIIKILEDKTI